MKRSGFLYTFSVLACLLTPAVTQAESGVALLERQQTLSGQPIDLSDETRTHLVFLDIWTSYAGGGTEAFVEQLPASFRQSTHQIWIQPEFNVTRAQLQEFQSYYPQVAPLVLDHQQALLKQFGFWQTPAHVLIEHGKVVFSGGNDALLAYLNPAAKAEAPPARDAETYAWKAVQPPAESESMTRKQPASYVVPKIGAEAPRFERQTLSDQTVSLAGLLAQNKGKQSVSLVFVDALCPMPHFPDCEDKLAQWQQQVESDQSRQWVGVISGYYIDAGIAAGFAEKFGLTAPLIFDTDNALYKAYGVHATPYQVDVGPQGRIQYRGDQIR
ncbi:redoxin domain-containing protein [Photobacterium sp. WH77]|uniref:peroxiredoxin family protein n=1 Tax=unclassified Photobacterium TaxID=2628852 RepID=UPI001EDA6873|nr:MULTISPECIES: redoxin domain-containing protein [unclassified Photobacterium]MCG2835307.1 redoxin domain-containing protein [Photobacterium sp. WH77]MCG2842920.1 redoxin domain-containing protein [Photobacterium sp. WH80]